MEYLVTMLGDIPASVADDKVKETHLHEIARCAVLAREDHLLRLWKPPAPSNAPAGQTRTLGLFKAGSDKELNEILRSLPMHIWSTFEIVPLHAHAHDPHKGK